MKISFIGDVMLGRLVDRKYKKSPYTIVDNDVKRITADSDLTVANLESPLVIKASSEGDHLQFAGNPDLLGEFDFVDLFSTANNHITDCGELGIDETLSVLKAKGFQSNGVFKKEYEAFKFEDDRANKYAILTLTDMLNIPFDESSKWQVLRMGDENVEKQISILKNEGYFIIVFAHVGILFTRYPNPIAREYLHKCIDLGADIVVTCHSHCLGGMEVYNNKYIFHSIGDFCMDGNSYRRRQASILNLNIEDGKLVEWNINPTNVTDELTVSVPTDKISQQMLESFVEVSKKIAVNSDNYASFFKNAYKKEIFNHSISTISFLYHQRGLKGLLRMIKLRFTEVFRTLSWMMSDRSKDQRDDNAIKANRKKFTDEELFGK